MRQNFFERVYVQSECMIVVLSQTQCQIKPGVNSRDICEVGVAKQCFCNILSLSDGPELYGPDAELLHIVWAKLELYFSHKLVENNIIIIISRGTPVGPLCVIDTDLLYMCK